MIVLGVDSGSLTTGYGVVEGAGNLHKALAYGAIRCRADQPHPERLAAIHRAIGEIIQNHRPEILALEEVFMARNAQSALKLGQVRGAVMVAASEAGVDVLEFSATQVKAAVTGYGRAEKSQVQLMVKSILGLAKVPEPNDAADALALAICALSRGAWAKKVAGA